jgi:hypothetical protein
MPLYRYTYTYTYTYQKTDIPSAISIYIGFGSIQMILIILSMIKLISHLELICYVHLLIKEAFRGISIQLVEVACQNKIPFLF